MEILHQFMKICGTLLLFCLRIHLTVSENDYYHVYLNSHTQCAHDITFEVKLGLEYLIQPNVSPKTRTNSFRECEVTFHSNKDDGHLCLTQDGKEAWIEDSNAELTVYDGFDTANDKPLFNLKPFRSTSDLWAPRDVCSETRFITFHLREIEKKNSADIRKIHLAFKIMDISSPNRHLYMVGSYCNMQYSMRNSMITLKNRPYSLGTPEKLEECLMHFRKIEPNSNNSICVVYIPHPDVKVTCDSQWEFVIFPNKNFKNKMYSFRCNESSVNQMHAWCGPANISLVTVMLERHVPFMSNSSVEPPGDFRFLMADHEGSADSLLEKVKASLPTNDSSLGILEISLICGSIALVLLIIIVIVNWKKLPCHDYSPVKKRDSTVGNDL